MSQPQYGDRPAFRRSCSSHSLMSVIDPWPTSGKGNSSCSLCTTSSSAQWSLLGRVDPESISGRICGIETAPASAARLFSWRFSEEASFELFLRPRFKNLPRLGARIASLSAMVRVRQDLVEFPARFSGGMIDSKYAVIVSVAVRTLYHAIQPARSRNRMQRILIIWSVPPGMRERKS